MERFRIQLPDVRISENFGGDGIFQVCENRVFPVRVGTLVFPDQRGDPALSRLGSRFAEDGRQMAEDDACAAPLDQNAFADAVGNVRIQAWHISAENGGGAGFGEPQLFAGKPLLRTVTAEVDHRIRTEYAAQIEIYRHILMRRRKCFGMIELVDVAKIAAHRFRQHREVAALQNGNDECAVFCHGC